MKVPPMRAVTRDEYLAYIDRFPDRHSYVTGICEPSQEHCVNDDMLIGRVVHPHPSEPHEPYRYWIAND